MTGTHRPYDVTEGLQEGVSCARATLTAIEGAGLLQNTPHDPALTKLHNHGLWLLAMLSDKLDEIQAKVDAASRGSVA